MDSLFFVALSKASRDTSPTVLSPMEPRHEDILTCTTQDQEGVVFTSGLSPSAPLPNRHDQRDSSFQVQYTEEEITQLSNEVYDGTIADVSLSLFSFWVNENQKHYEMAMEYIRELGLDQVCCLLMLLLGATTLPGLMKPLSPCERSLVHSSQIEIFEWTHSLYLYWKRLHLSQFIPITEH